MNRTIDGRLSRLEEARGCSRTCMIWAQGLTDAEVQAKFDRRVSDGRASADDKLLIVRWLGSGKDAGNQT
jgi:hypothetical protein